MTLSSARTQGELPLESRIWDWRGWLRRQRQRNVGDVTQTPAGTTDIRVSRKTVATAAILCPWAAPKEKGPKRSKRSRISGLYIPYGLFQTKGEPCAKFGSIWTSRILVSISSEIFLVIFGTIRFVILVLEKPLYILHMHDCILQMLKRNKQFILYRQAGTTNRTIAPTMYIKL
jgi:hypothetical protein